MKYDDDIQADRVNGEQVSGPQPGVIGTVAAVCFQQVMPMACDDGKYR